MCEEAIHSLNSSSLASWYGVNALFADGKRQFYTSSRCNERENKGKYIYRDPREKTTRESIISRCIDETGMRDI